MIKLENIIKKYDRTILDKVSLSFEYGKIYLIKGVSGCGKTSLLNIIGLIDLAFEGNYIIDGHKVNQKNKKEIELLRNKIGYVYQNSLLIASLSILDNLKMFNNDETEIMKWMQLFHVNQLMHKMPDELSNGERQRISLIRTLVSNKEILICDEPTASLDNKASGNIASEFVKLREQGKMILICTHEDCFDHVCDQVISLNYGACDENQVFSLQEDNKKISTQTKKGFFKQDIKYSLKQYKKNNKVSVVILVFFFLVLFVSLGFRLHFSEVYKDHLKSGYPYYTDTATKDYIEKVGIEDEVIIYQDHHFEQGDTLFYAYLPYRDSSLRIPDAITIGSFPKNDQEVLIDDTYCKRNFKGTDKDKIIGKKVKISKYGKEYTISGILTDDENLKNIMYGGNPYYQDFTSDKAIVFIDYDEISSYIKAKPHEFLMYALKNQDEKYLAMKSDILEQFTSWDTLLDERMFTINLVTNIIFLIAVVLGAITFLFLFNVISLDLFYRRKEIGYLRLFGVHKKRIKFILYFSYFYKIGIPLMISVILYYLGMLLVSFTYLNISLLWYEMLSLCIVIIIYVILLISIPIHRMIKSSVKELIQYV